MLNDWNCEIKQFYFSLSALKKNCTDWVQFTSPMSVLIQKKNVVMVENAYIPEKLNDMLVTTYYCKHTINPKTTVLGSKYFYTILQYVS